MPDTRAAGPWEGVGPSVEFTTLLEASIARAYRVALQLSGTAADAEDLLQEAALSAWRAFDGFQRGTNFRAWFLRIVTNAFYMRLRRDRRRGIQVPLDGVESRVLSTVREGWNGHGAGPAESALSRLATAEVVAAIHALPADYRAVATLYFMDDFTYQDIAEILRCPVGTVRSRLHRGRRLLRVRLADLARDHGIA